MERIILNLSKTFNLGNYESYKIHVGIERDFSEITQQDKDDLYEEVLKLIKDTALKINAEEKS